MRKPVCDAATNADMPKAAKNVWIKQPRLAPITDAIPALRPDAMVRAKNKLISGPGVMKRAMEAAE